MIKFAASLGSSSVRVEVTQSDQGILSLLATLSALTEQIAKLETQISEQQLQMVAYNAKKQLTLVKSHLIRRKQLQIILDKRITARDKLGEVLFSIEKAVGDEEVSRSMID